LFEESINANGDFKRFKQAVDNFGSIRKDRVGQIMCNLAIYGKLREASLLIERGADVNEPDKRGMTPLHHCAGEDNVEFARLLLEHGPNVNARIKFGIRPGTDSGPYRSMTLPDGSILQQRITIKDPTTARMCEKGFTPPQIYLATHHGSSNPIEQMRLVKEEASRSTSKIDWNWKYRRSPDPKMIELLRQHGGV
jgi:hypothetical protein